MAVLRTYYFVGDGRGFETGAVVRNNGSYVALSQHCADVERAEDLLARYQQQAPTQRDMRIYRADIRPHDTDAYNVDGG